MRHDAMRCHIWTGALLGNKALWTAAIDTAMTQFVPQIPEQFRPELPLAKEWVAARLAAVDKKPGVIYCALCCKEVSRE